MSLKPVKIMTGVYTMPYSYDAALHINHVISNRRKNVQIYIVEEPLQLMELMLSIDSLPRIGRDAEPIIPTTDRQGCQIRHPYHRSVGVGGYYYTHASARVQVNLRVSRCIDLVRLMLFQVLFYRLGRARVSTGSVKEYT